VHLPGLWEFPGGKREPGEPLEAALRREIQEELGVEIDVKDECVSVTHQYPTKLVELHFFNCTIREGDPRAIEVAEFRWVDRADLKFFQFPEADRELIEHLMKH
jgi:mutator protein MutT